MTDPYKNSYSVLSYSAQPRYLPYPRFLLTLPLGDSAKMIYALILERAKLSAVDRRWQESDNRLFVYYTVEHLAEATGKSPSVVKRSLAALEKAGLLARKHQGLCKPSKLYPFLPVSTEVCDKLFCDSLITSPPKWCRNDPSNEPRYRPGSRKTNPCRKREALSGGRKSDPSDESMKYLCDGSIY